LILLDLDADKVQVAGEYALETVEYASKANKRTLDQITAKVFFYLARAYEIQGRLAELQP
jgi:26S proteasome regulatory subunit N3